MASFNSITLVGNLTRDIDVRFLNSGTQIASFGIGVNRRYSSAGEQREEVLFIDVTAFGKLADICSQYLSKGSPVLVSGRLRLEQWETDDGQKRSKHSVTADTVQFLGRRDSGGDGVPARTAEDAGSDDIPF